jgi:hypothetical protein
MVDVTDGAHVAVRLITFEFLFRHFRSSVKSASSS